MKISKLFHWLYALLMFLPIIFFLPTCIYYGFNKHATNTETTDITFKYQSNEVNTFDDLIQGNIYHLDSFTLVEDTDLSASFNFDVLRFSNISSDGVIYDELSLNNFETCYFSFYYVMGERVSLTINFDTAEDFSYVYYDELGLSVRIFNCDFIYNSSMYSYLVEYDILPTYSNYNVIDTYIVNNDNTIPQQINRAWSSVWELPLFSWTHNSFVSVPFSYITSLFGVAQNSTLNYTLTYFASVSMIWLVFDLLMYVPLLCHRWLDKGVVE